MQSRDNENTGRTSFSQEIQPVRDRLEVADALYRFAAGIDFADADLLCSAFSEDAVANFHDTAVRWGFDFPLLEGRDIIVQALLGSVGQLDTTHTVTNPRATIDGDSAMLRALVEAQHLPPGDHRRHALLKSQYDVRLVRAGERWAIQHMIIDIIWHTGDLTVITGG